MSDEQYHNMRMNGLSPSGIPIPEPEAASSFAAPTGSAYRMLEEGEIIQEGDCFLDDAGMWRKTVCVGQPAPNPAFTAHRQYKRWLDTPNRVLCDTKSP